MDTESSVQFSGEFDHLDSPADHDDIEFFMNSPRQENPLNANKHDPGHSEIPVIMITEPSSACLVDLQANGNGDSEVETQDDTDDEEDFKTVNIQYEDSGITPKETVENNVSMHDEIEHNYISEVVSVTEVNGSNTQPPVQEEETVSLENIIMKDKTGSDSDSEFDFDLPVSSKGDKPGDPLVSSKGDKQCDLPVSSKGDKPRLPVSSKGDKPGSTTDGTQFNQEQRKEISENSQVVVWSTTTQGEHQVPEVTQGTFFRPADFQQHSVSVAVVGSQQNSGNVASRAPVTESQLSSTNFANKSPGIGSETTSQAQGISSHTTSPAPGVPQAAGSWQVQQKPVAVIKPRAQAYSLSNEIQAVPDEGTQSVLEAAQAEWDNVTTIQAGYKDTASRVKGVEPTVVQTVQQISPYELVQTFKQDDYSAVRSSIKTSVEKHGFAAFVSFLFGPPKLHRDLIEERDIVFCIAASQLNSENSCHMRTLQTIYRSLTGSKFDCPRFGSHWEQIGFQGTDPGTDLRGAGMLGLMNLLHLLKDSKKHQLSSDIYRLSLHPTQNFPFCVMGINLSRITLQTLREGLLNKECNRRHEVFGVVNDFYSALYLHLYQVWKTQGKTISDSGYVIKDLEVRAKKNPREVLKHLEDYLNKKTVVTSEKTVDPGGDNFVNVCDYK